MFVLKAKQPCLTRQYSAITTSPLLLYKAGHSPTDLLNYVNTKERRMKNLEIMIIRDCLPCTFPLCLTI